MYKIIGADQKEYGPITADQLRQWIAEGRANAQTKVQAEGAGVWKTVGELPEFAPALVAAHPSAPVAPTHIAMAPATPKTNPMALWAMILGIISLVPCCWAILGTVSIVLGIVALVQLKKAPQETGTGFAIAGIVLGAISLLLAIVMAVIVMTQPEFFKNLPNFQNYSPQ
jgi:hypothetical protein